MVAHWEKKVRDADYVEKTPQTKDNFVSVLSRGDPKRYLPDPPILFSLKECTQVCAMAQKMCKIFVETPELYGDFPPELRFLEESLTIKGGTALRKFMIEDFCPREEITPEGLREGMRRLQQQLQNMQMDPYADITNILDRLNSAMAVGSEDERDPYESYIGSFDQKGPGFFQTYTFNHNKLSLVRFLDGQYTRSGQGEFPAVSIDNLNLFGDKSANNEDEDVYNVPKERAAGRPHNLGWLQLLDDEKDDKMRLGKMPPGRIIPDDEWRKFYSYGSHY